MPETHIVAVTDTYAQEVFPQAGHGMRSGRSRTRSRDFQLALNGVRPEAAPVVATVAFSHGGRIALRSHGGKLYRPVLAPGTHAPCSLEGFQEACAGDRSWRDNPFALQGWGSDSNRAPKPVLETVSKDDGEVWRKIGGDDSREVEARLRLRGADLMVIDGTVYVECPEPSLVLKTVAKDPDDTPVGNLLTWSLPRLEGDDHPVTGPQTLKPMESHHKEELKRGREIVRDRRSFASSPWRFFQLVDLADAVAFGEALSDRQDLPFEVADGLAVVIVPGALSTRQAQEPGAGAREFLKDTGQFLATFERPFVDAWLDAREALRRGDAHGAATTLAKAAAEVDPKSKPAESIRWRSRVVDSNTWPGAAMLLRYVTCDAERAPSAAESAEDEEALAALAMTP